MAGHRAGLAAPTFPTMNDRLVPAGLFDGPLLAAVSDPLTVHFVHRALAYAAAVAVLAAAACAVRASRDGPVRAAATAAALFVALQVALGAATVLALVPVGLAAAHQANAVALLAALLVLLHALGWRPAGSAAPPATAG
jgi:cytochrome c oxidase assembly protein subunit 15